VPAWNPSWAELAVYVQVPSAAMEKLPCVPAVPVWATKAALESASEALSVPPVASTASVSARVTVWLETTVPSSVPRMWTVTEVGVPSAARTVNVSL
jgi:hypothetical protein